MRNKLAELQAQYEQASRLLGGARAAIEQATEYANKVLDNEQADISKQSAAAWRSRASEMVKELTKVEKEQYPSFNSVLCVVYMELRDTYGIVLDQLRKDFRYKYNTLRYPSAFEAISADSMVRKIFDSVLVGLFPESYFHDEVLDMCEGIIRVERKPAKRLGRPVQQLEQIIEPLAVARKDTSDDYQDTYCLVYDNMDCCWSNLLKRYMHKHNMDSVPQKRVVIMENPAVKRKFKKTVQALLAQAV